MRKDVVPVVEIAQQIHFVRDQKVLLAFDLAHLYGVVTKVVNQAVKRHAARFPSDFMFRLTREEAVSLRSQIVTLKRGENIERAVNVNIAIMRAFVQLRQALDTNRALAQQFAALERRVGKHDREISAIIDAIRRLMAPAAKPKRQIGFHVREKMAAYRTRKTR